MRCGRPELLSGVAMNERSLVPETREAAMQLVPADLCRNYVRRDAVVRRSGWRGDPNHVLRANLKQDTAQVEEFAPGVIDNGVE
jgi:hypothetical protein